MVNKPTQKGLTTAILPLSLLAAAFFAATSAPAVATESAPVQECGQALQNSCTSCHKISHICSHTREKQPMDGANWQKIMTLMRSEGAEISQEEETQLTDCLTNHEVYKQVVCPTQ